MVSPIVHQHQPVMTSGSALDSARGAVILLHGRGSTAQNILKLASGFSQERIAYLAPQAANQTWYPNSGFLPVEANEPYVSSAFQVLADLLARLEDTGIAPRQVVIGGFSQGACVAAEFMARHPRRYGGLFVLSGALLGPPDAVRTYSGSLDGTPIFVAGADRDPWVTEHQLRLTARILGELGGAVDIAVQSSPEHMIRPEESDRVGALISGLG